MSQAPASIVIAVRPPRAQPAGISELADLLAGAGVEVEALTPMAPEVAAAARWECAVMARLVDETLREFRVWLEPAPRETIERLLGGSIEWRGIVEEDRDNASSATWAMGVSTHFTERPLWDFHAQLKLLRAVAPDAVCVLDASAFTPRPGAWLQEVAGAMAPPSPESLYSIHCVSDQEGGPVWLHTHGLDRCGSIELDALDVPDDFRGLAAQLINVVGAMFIEHGVPEPDEPFAAGQGIDLVWLPWEQGLTKVPRGVPGGRKDRGDDEHEGARGILFAPRRGLLGKKYDSVARYRAILDDNPVLYLSDMATARAALLARERLPRFRALFEGLGDDKRVFLVKLGYAVDAAESDTDREHLWFEVHGLADDTVDATLLNQPYSIARMHEGQRATHSLSHLSDWTILCAQGRFDPNSVGELERLLARESRHEPR